MKRIIFAGVMLVALGYICFFAYYNNAQTPEGLSFETLFRYLGQPVKTVDRSITRVLGVNAKNERELGDVLAQNMEKNQVVGMLAEKAYVNSVIQELQTQYNPKELNYRVFIFHGEPNAFALPGGIIVVTTGMLQLLNSEAELVGILGHEKGHIDLGHCIDHMRIQAKTYQSSFGAFLDWYLATMLNHTFSKFQENEADRFGFESLIALQYDPGALSEAFDLMLSKYPQESERTLDILKDYTMTHPSLRIRAENWREKANRFKQQHPELNYYIGQQNYQLRKSRDESNIPNEWQTPRN
ncbi:MAG: M48 family metallopeptidase, partial [Proteobacteria bacterium]|nr:M48 family metallopeptidase [Pseudomonadota bacterium]